MMKLNVLTPEKKVLVNQEITEITVPVQSGERQILPGHVPMIASLGTGVLKYKIAGSDIQNKFVISWGYCEVNPEGVNILAEFIMSKEEVNEDSARSNIVANKIKLVNEILTDADYEIALNEIQKSESALTL
ncbi:MAG: ATP synthase F1 subunit epsilon [Moraxellaceae bacterium]|nr:ATP synthase F1 subunit epsilon [Pseudobdellovibrionaceae bacterium]